VNNQQDSGLNEKELDIQKRKHALEEKHLALEMEDREAARQSQEATINAMLVIITAFTKNPELSYPKAALAHLTSKRKGNIINETY
jgi:hypothetical protein